MKITFLGHASFLIESEDGKRIITDPYRSGAYNGAVKYREIDEHADIVTVSHKHDDHNNAEAVKGNPDIVDTPGEHEVRGVRIKGIKTYHDPNQGKERGENIVFVYDIEGKRVCHLGDLGEVISDEKAKEIGEVDVLLIPVGGYFTIGPEEADRVIEKLNPRIVIPMHYKTESVDFPISPVDDFLKGKEYEKVEDHSIEIREIPDKRKIYVLRHKL